MHSQPLWRITAREMNQVHQQTVGSVQLWRQFVLVLLARIIDIRGRFHTDYSQHDESKTRMK